MLLDEPDHAAWLAAMDAVALADPDSRLALVDRLDSELTEHEPVIVVERREDWSLVSCPWQPFADRPDGYQGWVRSAHLTTVRPEPGTDGPADGLVDATKFLNEARRHIGLRYLWGGLTPRGLDCSGLVHHSARRLGVRVPRDAGDQCRAAEPVELTRVQPGDLYFFAEPDAPVHHVGIVVEPGVMLHAPETGGRVIEESLSPERHATLVAAGRIAR